MDKVLKSKHEFDEISSIEDNSGVDRLITAILMQAIRDWKKYVKEANSPKKRNTSLYELKRIIDFIYSDWFVYLTNANCPQTDCVNGLIAQVFDNKLKEELMDYSLISYSRYKTNGTASRTVVNAK